VTDWSQEVTPFIETAAATLGRKLSIQKIQRLSGGAINQNFLVELSDHEGALLKWVLRRGQSLPIPGSLDRASEYAMVTHADAIGMTVAKPVALVNQPQASASIFQWCEGQTEGRTLLGQLASSPPDAIRGLAQSLGAELGRLHGQASSTQAGKVLAGVLGKRPGCGFSASIDLLTKSFARVKAPKRYLTEAFQHCVRESEQVFKARGNASEPACVSHNDFRLGNLMIEPKTTRLTAVLDWEFTAWGDPLADIGWLTAPCWRFGGQSAVAGFGEIDDLLTGYASANEDSAHRQRLQERVVRELHFWQRYAHLRWAIIAAQQGERAVSGDSEALELLLTGAMVASILEPTLGHYWGDVPKTTLQPPGLVESELDRLLSEAGLHLKSHLASGLSGPQRYSALMSANAIRLARGALRLPKPDSMSSTGSDSSAMLAKEELAEDLAVWNFRG
jgi:aminoglycoside phosphotransferase (APT) family kinase protein